MASLSPSTSALLLIFISFLLLLLGTEVGMPKTLEGWTMASPKGPWVIILVEEKLSPRGGRWSLSPLMGDMLPK